MPDGQRVSRNSGWSLTWGQSDSSVPFLEMFLSCSRTSSQSHLRSAMCIWMSSCIQLTISLSLSLHRLTIRSAQQQILQSSGITGISPRSSRNLGKSSSFRCSPAALVILLFWGIDEKSQHSSASISSSSIFLQSKCGNPWSVFTCSPC